MAVIHGPGGVVPVARTGWAPTRASTTVEMIMRDIVLSPNFLPRLARKAQSGQNVESDYRLRTMCDRRTAGIKREKREAVFRPEKRKNKSYLPTPWLSPRMNCR